MSMAYVRPDWVMLGAPYGDGVMILASLTLSRAELEAVADEYDLFDPYTVRATHTRFTLTVEMPRFTIVMAPDYPTAFTNLFRQWSPRPAGRPAVEGRPMLPPGASAR